MDRERWLHIRALFEEAVILPPTEREAFLDRRCIDDAELRERVEALLAADESADAFFEETPDALAQELFNIPAPPIPERIGPYAPIRILGRGGMGTVYLAQRDDATFEQVVALKVIRRGMDSDDILRRFRAERQILARLHHPNIAQLYDGGMTEDGLPYFAMEYLEGLPITTHCDKRQLNLSDRLTLFSQVCAAVQHAHDAQVIHRDLKPSNILVTRTGIPKLLDFGIAKVLNPDLLGVSVAHTRTGFRVMTPEYASPEQIRQRLLTPRTDVYSLGVILYELLTGHRPYRLTGHTTHEIEQIICESEPMLPSTAIRATKKRYHPDETAPIRTPEHISQARATTPDSLRRQLRGDLDTIVLHALHKDPSQRYASPAILAEDVHRFLQGQPIQARRTTFAYRTKKLILRHPARILLILTVLLLVMGLTGLAWQKSVEEPSTASPPVPPEHTPLIAVLPFDHQGPEEQDYFADGMADAIIAHMSGLDGVGVIARSSTQLFKNTTKTPSEIGAELGVDFILEGSIQFEHPTNPTGRIRVIAHLIRATDNTNLWAASYEEVVSDVFAIQSRIAGQVADALNLTLTAPSSTLRSSQNLTAYNYYLRGNEFFRNDEDATSLRLAETMYTEAVGHDSTFAEAYAALAKVHAAQWFHRVDPSDERCERAHGAAEQALVYAPDLPYGYESLGMYFYRCQLNLLQALHYFDRALDLQPDAIDALRGKAFVLRRQGKMAEALVYFERLVTLDPLQADYAALAFTHQMLRNYSASEQMYLRALDHFPDAALLYATMARMYLAWTGSPTDALIALDQGISSTIHDDFTRITAIYIELVGQQYQKVLDRISALDQEVFDTQTFYIPSAHLKARAYRGMGQAEEARQQESLARQHLEAYLRDHPDDARAYTTLGRVYAGLRLKEEALQAGQRGLDLMPITRDAVQGPLRAEDMAAIYTLVGETEAAIDQLEALLAHPGFTSPRLFSVDPTWAPLREHPRFQALIHAGV